jgi:lipopolysaccharide export system protein LptC
MPSLKTCLLILVPAATALAATTKISSDQPIVNFSTSTFTADGHRAWLLRASQALPAADLIKVTELTLSIFPGKADGEKVETMILSPSATVLPEASVVSGTSSIRVINDEFEATGLDWRYNHKDRRITIARKVHVVFQAELKEFLK